MEDNTTRGKGCYTNVVKEIKELLDELLKVQNRNSTTILLKLDNIEKKIAVIEKQQEQNK